MAEILIGIGAAVAISIPIVMYVTSEPRWLVVTWEAFKAPIYRYRGWRLDRR